MTCIVALKTTRGIYMGADRASVSLGEGMFETRVERNPKVFKKNNMLLGFCGSFYHLQKISNNFNPPEYLEEVTPFEYLISEFIPSLEEFIKNLPTPSVSIDKDDGPLLSTFILGFQGEIFIVNEDFSISSYVDKFESIGFGASYALGSLYSTQIVGMSPKERVNLALASSMQFSSAVKPPFDILYLKNS